ncbi:MAG: hypothetical protein PHR83_09395 [Paludibacter sp.]|nr:hypothetical protein [Paludibacter sp.]
MNEIGGYFELELRTGNEYHFNAIKLNSGRNCLEYILRARGYKKIYIPYFTCDVILEPINKLGILYEFYSIDKQLDPVLNAKLENDEALLYTNYFGIKSAKVIELSSTIKNLIIDNSQAFFSNPIDGIDTFYSARKFFGVPDGAYLYTTAVLEDEFEVDKSFERFSHLLKRIDLGASKGFDDFRKNDSNLSQQPIKYMSKLTKSLLCNIDYEFVREKRIENFNLLHSNLSDVNQLNFQLSNDSVPMVYPYLTDRFDLRQKLIDNKIYIATYWPNILQWCDENQIEYFFTNSIVPLPLDQRFDFDSIKLIIDLILL